MKLNRTLLLLFTIVGMLPPLIFRAIRWYQGDQLSNLLSFGKGVLISVITTVSISYAVVQLLIWLQRKHPWSQGIAKRLFLELFLTTFTACGLIVILTLLMLPIAPQEDLAAALFRFIIVAFILNIALVAITEGIFFFQAWRASSLEAERFKEESLRAQLESLKSQVNPHFLFNSLNTLSGLIDHDKELSKAFVDDLSTVYRYVLEHKDEELVSLETELDFIHAFTQLLQKRHGDRISFQIDIRQADLKKGIPPMTLQLLVENAVKHNIASKKSRYKWKFSVKIRDWSFGIICSESPILAQTGVGLQNIRERYHYLTDEEVKVEEGKGLFKVRIPLIALG